MNDKNQKRPRRQGADVGFDVNSEIGTKLQAFYNSLQDEPIPEKFLDLLEKLDAAEQKNNGSVGA